MSEPRTGGATRPRPDPGPLRIAIGFGAVAATSALVTALSSPAGGGTAAIQPGTVVTVTDPAPLVRHVVQYIQLEPGQTAPPQSVVQQAPAPKPRVVVVTTRQSGAKP